MTFLTAKEREFPRFAQGVLRATYEATITHPDTFLYALGALANVHSKTARWGRPLMGYVALRQFTEVVGVIAKEINFHALVIRDNPVFQKTLHELQNG